ncbi:aldolase/citrate lyase family protein, partial [Listeria monocytogenes]|uniref:aldolase/citrate lyase family protein n=1 Tax=Listeria monocytogenes TaxID=1639 RepID=UPI002FDBB179
VRSAAAAASDRTAAAPSRQKDVFAVSDPADPAAALQACLSYLFVPGDRPERFDKAVAAKADAVIIDLEDAVPDAAKAAARE